MNRTAWLAVVAVAALSCASPLQAAADFGSFWTMFRRAALENDITTLVTMTRFPLESRGPTDSDPVVRITREEFPQRFRSLLEQDSGMRAEPETLRECIERMVTVNVITGSARVADLAFEQVEGRWWLVRVYRSK